MKQFIYLITFTIVLITAYLQGYSQRNLLLNGNFKDYKIAEDYTQYLDSVGERIGAKVQYWENNVCGMMAHNTMGHSGPIFARVIAYQQISEKDFQLYNPVGTLCRPLQKDKKYKVSFYAKQYEASGASNLLAVTFTSVIQPNFYYFEIKKHGKNPPLILESNPAFINTKLITDTNFTKIEFIYTANGTEQYMVIGNPYSQKPSDWKELKKTKGSLRRVFPYQNWLMFAVSDMWVTPLDSTEEGCLPQAVPMPTTIKNMLLPDTIVLQTLYYENDKYLSNIRIDKTIEALKQYPPDAEIIVTGHTDKEGSEQHNWELSELRAKAIGEYVQRQLPDRKVSHKGYGYSRPIELVSPSPINRRVEISVID